VARARALALAVALAVLLGTSAARATPTARLVYSRSTDAESCPDEPALRHAVAARVGYDPFFPYATRTVVATLTRRDGAFVATVDLVDERGIAHGARELRSTAGCSDLLDTVALTIAIAIDPQSLAGPAPAPASAPAPAPAPAPASAPAPAPAPALASAEPDRDMPTPRPPTSPRSTTVEASAGAVASLGVAPGPAVGVALGADLRWRLFSLGVEGRVDAPASKAAQGGGEVSSWLTVGALVPCAYYGPLMACALLQGGSMQSSATGVPDTHPRQVAWWAAGGRIGVLLPLGADLHLRLRTDVVADLQPATLELDGGSVWPAPAVAASFGADALLRFP